MSNGAIILEEVKDLMESGDIPQKVSNRLILASVYETNQRLEKHIEATNDDNEKRDEKIVALQVSDRRWGGVSVFVAAIITGVGAWFSGNN